MSSANARLQRVVDHRVAAVLDHHDLAVELLEPRQRLDSSVAAFASAACGRGRRSVRSCRVRRVLVDVVVGEVVGPDRRRRVAGVQVDRRP